MLVENLETSGRFLYFNQTINFKFCVRQISAEIMAHANIHATKHSEGHISKHLTIKSKMQIRNKAI